MKNSALQSRRLLHVCGWIAAALTIMCPAPSAAQPAAVIYTSTDQEYAEVILKELGDATGLKVAAVFDAGASKTVGLERRPVAEKRKPQADLLWNSEFLRADRPHKPGVQASHLVIEIAVPTRGQGFTSRMDMLNKPVSSSRDWKPKVCPVSS